MDKHYTFHFAGNNSQVKKCESVREYGNKIVARNLSTMKDH